MVSEAEEMDASEAAVSDDIRDDGLPLELRHRGERLARLQRCLARLQREADAQAVLQQAKLDARAQAQVCRSGSQRGGQSQPNRSGQPGDEEFQGVGSGLQCSSDGDPGPDHCGTGRDQPGQ